MSELDEALQLANRVLDRPSADPDDDLAMLARQLVRQSERAQELEGRVNRYRDLVVHIGSTIGANVLRDSVPEAVQRLVDRVAQLSTGKKPENIMTQPPKKAEPLRRANPGRLLETRRLLDGTEVPEGDPTALTIGSRCPAKWLFVDLQTGDIWQHQDDTTMFRRADDAKRACLRLVVDGERGG